LYYIKGALHPFFLTLNEEEAHAHRRLGPLTIPPTEFPARIVLSEDWPTGKVSPEKWAAARRPVGPSPVKQGPHGEATPAGLPVDGVQEGPMQQSSSALPPEPSAEAVKLAASQNWARECELKASRIEQQLILAEKLNQEYVEKVRSLEITLSNDKVRNAEQLAAANSRILIVERDLVARRQDSKDFNGKFKEAKRIFARTYHPDNHNGSDLDRLIRSEVFKEFWAVLEKIERQP
jgi:hypothetical protein